MISQCINNCNVSEFKLPKNIDVKYENQQIILSWEKVNGARFYYITVSNGSKEVIKTWINSNHYLITNVAPGIKYTVQVFCGIDECDAKTKDFIKGEFCSGKFSFF